MPPSVLSHDAQCHTVAHRTLTKVSLPCVRLLPLVQHVIDTVMATDMKQHFSLVRG